MNIFISDDNRFHVLQVQLEEAVELQNDSRRILQDHYNDHLAKAAASPRTFTGE